MLRFVAVVAAMVAAVNGDAPPPPAYKPAPAPYKPAPAYKQPAYDESPKPYAYEYAVKDDYSGANFAAQETADGKSIFNTFFFITFWSLREIQCIT